jgi:hypothetical protein
MTLQNIGHRTSPLIYREHRVLCAPYIGGTPSLGAEPHRVGLIEFKNEKPTCRNIHHMSTQRQNIKRQNIKRQNINRGKCAGGVDAR